MVVIGGDLNAHVSFTAGEEPVGRQGDIAGGLLVDLARNCELKFGIQHDLNSRPTFHTNFDNIGPVSSCPDHVLMSMTAPATYTCEVRLDVPGSDHRPIALDVEWTAAQPVPLAHLHAHYPNGRLHWQGRESDYCAELLRAKDAGSFDELLQLLQGPDVDIAAAANLFEDLIRFAGVRSGHYKPASNQTHVLSTPSPVTKQPWFDTECQQARRYYKLCLRNLPYGHATLRTAAREYESLRRRKKRQWSKQAVDDLVDQAQRDPRAFWKRFAKSQRPPPASISAADADACISSLQAVLVSDAQPSECVPPGHLTDSVDHQLNQPFSEHDVELVLGGLTNNRSCGPDGVPAEFLKYAVRRDESGKVQEYILAPYLTKLFNICFDVGRVPDHWCTALLSLVYKKGDKLDWQNYRPLAVTQVISKVYALLLHKRLTRWAEGQQLLTPAQAGFRPGHSTTMNIFLLLHFIHKYRRLSQPLFTCFLDLSKAYDRVVRQHVWDRLHGFGCQGKLLFAVAALYENVTYKVKFQNGASAPFHTNSGLRQGCPLSPFLFNVIIQKLWEVLQDLCPDTGPALAVPADAMLANPGNGGGATVGIPSNAIAAAHAAPGPAPDALGHGHSTAPQTVPAVMFADDVKYMACTQRHSQRQMHATELFLSDERMVVGFDKTKHTVFNATFQTPAERRAVLTLQSRPVEKVTEYIDLGLLTKQQHTVAGMLHHAARRGQRAVAILHKRVKELGVRPNACVMLKLFQAIVLPNLTFGVEAWGPWFLHCDFADGVFQNDLERVRLSFLRVLLGLKSSSPAWNTIREVGWYPLQVFVARQLVRWMNKLWRLPASNFARRAMLECWLMYRAGDLDNWCGKLSAFLAHFDITPSALLPENPAVPLFSEQLVVDKLRAASHAVYTDLVAAAAATPELDSKLAVFHVQFADDIPPHGTMWQRARYLDLPLGMNDTKLLARFRLSNHYLRVEVGRWHRPDPLPMPMRTCTLCDGGCVQNEHHWMFDCPALQSARDDCPAVFANGQFAQLRKLFGLDVEVNARLGVAKNLCRFLHAAGGIYAVPVALPNADNGDE
jgi:hypothetical protein